MILIDLFITFFIIGLFTIGGGYAMIPLINQEILSKGWAESGDLVDFIGIAESTPGPFAVNIATFIGSKQAGVLGSIIATCGTVLPSYIIILIIAKFYIKFKQSKYVTGMFEGVRPVAVGLIYAAGFSVAWNVLFSGGVFRYPDMLIMAGIFAASRLNKLHPAVLILISAGLGILLFGVLKL